MRIYEAVLHEIVKTSGTHGAASVTVTKASGLLPVDEVLANLCEDLRALIDKAHVGYGTLGNTSTFPAHLDEYLRGDVPFLEMSSRAMDLLAHEMGRANFATGGYAFFARYTYAQKDYVLVAMLKIRAGAGVDENLQLQETLTVDLSKLHEAARINLTRRGANEQPYLTFAKGARQGDVTAYFREALSCTDYTDSKSQTAKAIDAAHAYLDQRTDLDDAARQEERLAMRKRLVECFDSVGKADVNPAQLAVAIAPSSPEAFSDFLAQDGNAEKYGLNAPFTPHKSTYGKLRRISGTIGGTVKVAFDVEDVTRGKVAYDDQLDAVILKTPGESLKKAIRENTPNRSA